MNPIREALEQSGGCALEGAELIQWRQMDIAAKSIAPIENVPVLPEPENRGAETR